ncbi:hypothetical protein L1049_005531 [Liquidambar formosana]|uniref:Uncharacterized protein n=1 Tax=Liquidambar formosana TaxID=63359 RepID=A0AAP0RDX3_LIQFO
MSKSRPVSFYQPPLKFQSVGQNMHPVKHCNMNSVSMNSPDDAFHDGPKAKNSDCQESDLPRILANVWKCIPNGPSLDLIWKGSFEIPGTASCSGLYHGFLAYPPVKVSGP